MARPLAIYIHWPFCHTICPYCDFNVARARSIDEDMWSKAYLQELEHMRSLYGPAQITSIFFGGGTPSLMSADLVRGLIDKIASLWSLDEAAEISLEANPTDAEAEKFSGFFSAGVNRLSLGVQSLRDKDLTRLGRNHDAQEALRAFHVARNVFPNVSCDLIYARPEQTELDWEKELEEMLALPLDHLSLYQLTIEPGTAFEKAYQRGTLKTPQDDLAAKMYDLSQEICATHNLPGYETSNHASEKFQSRHNLTYWRYGDYLGIGPGAHGRIALEGKKISTVTIRKPNDWLTEVIKNGHVLLETEALSRETQGIEFLLMGLRLAEGVDLMTYEHLTGHVLEGPSLSSLIEEGLLQQEGTRLRTTPQGQRVLDGVLERLLT